MEDIESSIQKSLTLDQWKEGMAEFSGQVADNIDRVMNGGSPDARYTLRNLQERVAELDKLGIKPVGDDDFNKHIELLLEQKPGNINTDVIRFVASYLKPQEQTKG